MANSGEVWPQTPCPSGLIGTRPPNARDKAWRYAYEAPNEPGKVICIRCEKVISGGINRLKYHLASITKHDTNPCKENIEEIQRFCNALLAVEEEKKLHREGEKLAVRAAIAETQGVAIDLEEEEEALESIVGSLCGPCIRKNRASFTAFASSSRTRVPPAPSASGIDNYFVHRNTPGAQPSLEATGWNKEAHDKTDIACAYFWFFNNIPWNVIESPYWLNLVTAMTVAGKGYKFPSRKDLSGKFLPNAVERAKLVVEEQRKEWSKYGCTILFDGWTDGRNRTIINFLVACKDDVFWKSVDVSNKVKNAQTLALMLENVIIEVGVENVVQIIIDNAAAYVAAGRILQDKHPHSFLDTLRSTCP